MTNASLAFVWSRRRFCWYCKSHQHAWEWIGSDVLAYELGQIEDAERRERLLLLAGQSHQTVEMTGKILTQAEKLETSGFDSYDAIHLASAENAGADVFLTTDDNFQKVASRNEKMLSFIVENPVKWLEEILK